MELITLLHKYEDLLNFAAKEANSCTKSGQKGKTIRMLVLIIKNSFLCYYGMLDWYKAPKIRIEVQGQPTRTMQITNDEVRSFTNHMKRALVLDVWMVVEDLFRDGNHNDKISNILNTRFSNNVPASIEILRLMRNSYHSNMIHRRQNETLYFVGRHYHFARGKKVKYFHPSRVFELIKDVIVQIRKA